MAKHGPIKTWEELKAAIEYLRGRKRSIIHGYYMGLEKFRNSWGDSHRKSCGEVLNLESRCREFLEQYPDDDKKRQEMERRLKVPSLGIRF